MTLAATRRRTTLARERARILPPLERRFAIAVADGFRGMVPRIRPGLEAVIARRVALKADTDLATAIEIELRRIAWDQETRTLSRNVTPVSVLVGEEAAAAVGRELGIEGSLDLGGYELERIRADVGTQIRRVTDTSRARIAREVAEGIEKGLSVEQIVNGVRPGTTNVRGPVPAFRGIRGLVDSWTSTGSPGFAGAVGTVPLRSSRAYLIALTESGNSFNRSAIEGYARSGLVDFVEVFDGPDCGWTSHNDPELAHGSIRSLAEAKARPLAHPRCQRAFGARMDARAASPSPYQGRDRANVPGATPGLRPDDLGPLSGRVVPRAPAAVSPFRSAGGELARATALEAAAERIRYTQTHETAVAVDADGNVVLDKADPTKPRSVHFERDEVARMRGTTVTHNHPVAYQGDLLHATSFSPEDVTLYFDAGLREIRAVGKGADYIFRADATVRKAEVLRAMKEADLAIFVEWKATIDAATKAAEEVLRAARESARIPGGGFDFRAYADAQDQAKRIIAAAKEPAERLHQHRVWTRVAEQFPGIHYEQILRPEKP